MTIMRMMMILLLLLPPLLLLPLLLLLLLLVIMMIMIMIMIMMVIMGCTWLQFCSPALSSADFFLPVRCVMMTVIMICNFYLSVAACKINNNNNNNRIQRCYSRFFTISSQRRELSPTRTFKWPGHVQNIERLPCASVMLRATWYEGTAQLLSLTELNRIYLSFILLAEPLNR